MQKEQSFPNLKRPGRFLGRLILGLIRIFIIRPLQIMVFLMCLVAGLFARRDINLYKINSLLSLLLNFVSKVI